MGLFKPDLYRNFAVGFVLGAGLVAWQIAPSMMDQIAPAAHAAPMEAPTGMVSK